MTSEIYILAHAMALYRAGRLGEVIDLLSVSPIGRKCEDFAEARAILAMSTIASVINARRWTA